MFQYRTQLPVPQPPLLGLALDLRLLPVAAHPALPEIVLLLPLLRHLPVSFRNHCQIPLLRPHPRLRRRLGEASVLPRLLKAGQAEKLFLRVHRHYANHQALLECSKEQIEQHFFFHRSFPHYPSFRKKACIFSSSHREIANLKENVTTFQSQFLAPYKYSYQIEENLQKF